tara:strand:+ start:2580 stop:3050 length:471 start_codon:yes stop_codon:yes gene_type:complete
MSTPSGTKTGFNQVRIAETLEVDGAVIFESGISGPRNVSATAGATKTVAASESGTAFVQTASSGTTTYTLPAATAGLTYTFVCGNAGGEILITPATGDAIVTKIHSAQDGTALAPAAGTGIKNTTATNVAGDSITLVALDTTTWYGTSIIGLWASQ